MAGDWIDSRLSEIAVDEDRAFSMGPFGSNIRAENYQDSGVPVLRGTNLGKPSEPRFRPYEYAYISEAKADELSSSNAHSNDIVFVAQGTVGKVGIIPTDTGHRRFVLSQNLMKVTVDPTRADPLYFFYFFRSPLGQHEILSRVNPTGVPCISKPLTSLREFSVRFPRDIVTQQAISCMLGALDDKIELNRRMNRTLEAITRAIFKSWFEDFDPVRAKAEGRQPPGLSPHIADLFPDSFEDSEIGEIPRGWKVKDLSQVTAQITKGTTPTQADINAVSTSDTQINYLRVNAIADDGSILYDKLTKIPRTVHERTLKRSILQTGDVLYTIAGTIGRITIVRDDLLPANTNQAVALVRPNPMVVPPGFLALTMKNHAFQEELHSNVVHAVQANLSLGMISRAKAVFPPEESIHKIFKPINDILEKSVANGRESHTFAALRDVLLSKLISGDLRVPDAERIVGRCT